MPVQVFDMHLYAWENKENYFNLDEIESSSVIWPSRSALIRTEPVLVGQHDCSPGAPRPRSTPPSPTPHYSLTFPQPPEYNTVTELGSLGLQRWLYIHNSVLPHSSQYIAGGYVTIKMNIDYWDKKHQLCLQHKWNTHTNLPPQRLRLLSGAVLRAHTTRRMLDTES